jgi:hypothetical protein
MVATNSIANAYSLRTKHYLNKASERLFFKRHRGPQVDWLSFGKVPTDADVSDFGF